MAAVSIIIAAAHAGPVDGERGADRRCGHLEIKINDAVEEASWPKSDVFPEKRAPENGKWRVGVS